MRVSWRVAITVISVAPVLGAVFVWRSFRSRANAQQLNNEVQFTLAQAKSRDAVAEEKLGGMYFFGRGEPQSYENALRWYRAAAVQGYARAQFDMGFLYEKGTGVQQDFNEADRWYEQATNKDDEDGECGLATMYYHGRGVPQDYAKAALLYRRSADQGLALAQYDLGYMYYHGQGVPQDRTEGRLWIRKAANQGDEHAREALGMKLTPWLMVLLAVQVLVGFLLVSRPLSFNLWERNEGMHDSHDWLSVGTGVFFLMTAGLGWYGYTHNLIWCLIYGVTGFALLRWFLNTIALVLLYFVFFRSKPLAPEGAQEEL